MAISMTKFRTSLQGISKKLSKDDVESLVFLSRDLLNDETIANNCQATGNALDFFEAMLRHQLYSPSNCTMLLDHLHSIKRLDLINEVKASLGLQQGMPDRHSADPAQDIGSTTAHPVQATADKNHQPARELPVSKPPAKPPPVPPKKPYHPPKAQPGRQNMPAASTREAEASLHGDEDSSGSSASQTGVPTPMDQTASLNGQGATEEAIELMRKVCIDTHKNEVTSKPTACTTEAQTVEEYELLKLSHDLPISKLNPLGQELGFSAARVSQFQYDNSCNISAAFFKILVAWKNNQRLSSNMRERLATHLENIDCKALADHLRMEKYRQK